MLRLGEMSETQPQAVARLRQAITSGRMHHAYLLAGAAETRPEQLAQAIAATLVCSARTDADACGVCPACRKLAGGNHPDVLRVTPDEKENISIDTVRELAGRLALRAVEAPTKVAIIERAEAMRATAQNALLKTLEEPTGPTCFLLTTNRPRQLLATIRSRSLLVRLAPVPRRGARQTLADAGVAAELTRPLAALTGDPVCAQGLLDRGAAEILAVLKHALAPEASLSDILAAAADLAGNRDRAELAAVFVELAVRDALAHGQRVDSELLCGDEATARQQQMSRLPEVVDLLQEYRRRRQFNLNQTYAFENILLTMTGRLRPTQPASPQDINHEQRFGAR